MLEEFYYRRKRVVEIDAAVVGVSRLRWRSVAAEEAEDVERVRAIMEKHQFDVLPIDGPGRAVRSYMMTERWGEYRTIHRHEIEFDDVIPQQTPLSDVIRQFAEHGRRHFFLAHENAVTGLITVVNLNCRQARTFLFSLLCDLEIRLGQLIQSHIGDDLPAGDVLAESKKDVRERYAADRAAGVDRELVEYLYLTDMLKIIRKRRWYDVLGYTSASSFHKDFGKLSDLRNSVAHPGVAMIRKPNEAEKLWRDVQVIDRALFRLRRHERAAA